MGKSPGWRMPAHDIPHPITCLCQLAVFSHFSDERFNPHSYLPRFSSMGFIRSAGSCRDSGPDVYRTSDTTYTKGSTMQQSSGVFGGFYSGEGSISERRHNERPGPAEISRGR